MEKRTPLMSVGFWTHHSSRLFEDIFNKRAQESLSLASKEAFILMMLNTFGPKSLAEIAKIAKNAHPSILRHIDSLEATGYVERRPHAEDRRIKVIHLTESGKKIVPAVFDTLWSVHSTAVQGFEPEELEALLDQLKRIHDNLQKESDLEMVPMDMLKKMRTGAADE